MAGFSPSYVRELDDASQLAKTREDKLTELSKEIGEMNFLKLIWDSKIPEDKKSFLNRISFKCSDPDVIKEEINKYQHFYAQMKAAMQSTLSEKQGNCEDIEIMILDLYENLTDMVKEAESGEMSTDSKIICELHREFVSKHEKLENILRRVESGALRQKQKMLTKDLERALKMIDTLADELKEAKKDKDDMKTYLNEMKEETTEWKKHREEMLEDNRKTMKLLAKKEDDNDELKQQQKQLMEDNKQIRILLEKLLIDKK